MAGERCRGPDQNSLKPGNGRNGWKADIGVTVQTVLAVRDMLEHFPIDIGFPFDANESDLLKFDWQSGAADFSLPDKDSAVLRVSFHDAEVIVRMLSEVQLSLESDHTTWRGLIEGCLAYRVEGATFSDTQKWVWSPQPKPTHYRFITQGGCLDVLSEIEPTFSIVPTAS